MVNNRLMEWRTKCKYSRQLIADCLGVSRDTISKFEKGDISKLNLEHLFILCGKQIEINVGINPTYEKKGYNRTKTGYIIPMMDCELGYLLGEEGYENRTRAKTDICKATGLSEVAVSALENLRELKNETPLRISALDGEPFDLDSKMIIDTIRNLEKTRKVMVLAIIEQLLVSTEAYGICTKLENAIHSMQLHISPKFNYSFYDPDNYLPIIHEVENNGMYLMHCRDAAEYFINEASLAFKNMLKEMLPKDKE